MSTLFRSPRNAWYMVACLVGVLVYYKLVQGASYSARAASDEDVTKDTLWTKAGARMRHPIEYLVHKSQDEFDNMLGQQSKDLTAAVEEYQRRYNRKPPPGFDQWFTFATFHGSLIIDEFNDIHNMLEPFWEVEPDLLRRAVRTISKNDDDAIGYVKVEKLEVHKNKTTWIGDGLMGLITDFDIKLPDLELMVSGADEPMLLRSSASHGIDKDGSIRQISRNGLTWADIQKPCEFRASSNLAQAPRWKTADIPQSKLHNLPFVTNKYDETDLCKHPEYNEMHDLGRSCADDKTKVYDGLVPIFSQAAPSTYGDIYFPTVQYWGGGQLPIHDRLPWDQKKNALYWKGSTTGGWALESNDFHYFLRHRFVEFVQGLTHPTYKLLQQSRLGYWYGASTSELPTDKYNVHFSAVIQCKPESECKKQQEFYKMGAYGAKNESLGYKFIMDIDGNTFANRYYRSLSSGSVVLKQTGFREWHDERLFPWVHYVPISIHNDELPEVMRYLTETEKGQALAKEIAGRANHWGARVLRKIDASVFTYRLMLEYARLMQDGRHNLGFDLPSDLP